LYKALGVKGLILHWKSVTEPGLFCTALYPLPERMSAILSHWVDRILDKPNKRGKVGITFEERRSAWNTLSAKSLVWEKKEISIQVISLISIPTELLV